MSEPVTIWTRLTDVCYQMLVIRARDLTESTAGRSALIVAPHPDDETFGCAATILRKRAAGSRVTVCVVSDGGAFPADDITRDEIVTRRYANVREACRRLGIPDQDVLLLGFPDSELGTQIDSVASSLTRILSELNPDEIFIPSSIDWHSDHVAVHAASLRAAAQSQSVAALYTYPIWFWSRDAWAPPGVTAFRRKLSLLRDFVFTTGIRLRPQKVLTSGYLESKRDLMEIYGWELQQDYDFFEKWHLRTEELFFATTLEPRGRT
jgi:LmbE family N-acetylglucosaminyl deacetylase